MPIVAYTINLSPFELKIDFTVVPNLPSKAASLKNLNAFNNLGSLANLKNPEDCKPSGTIGNENITITNSILWLLTNFNLSSAK